MLSDKLKQLIEAITSIGYEIEKLDCHNLCNADILLFPVPTDKLASNTKLVQLVETLCSIGFEITEYNCDYVNGETKISLRVKALSFADFLDAVTLLPDCKNDNGLGRAASSVAKQFNVSLSLIYKVKKILKYGSQELVDSLRNAVIPVNTAYKRLIKECKPEPAGRRIRSGK